MLKKAHLLMDQQLQENQASQMILHIMNHIEACSTRSFQDGYEEV